MHATIGRRSVTGRRTAFVVGLMALLGLWAVQKNAGVYAAQDCGDSLQVSASPGSQVSAVADPRPSFDGTHLLFAAQTGQQNHWQIFESSADGSNKRQITHCAGDCMQAEYLPGGQIVYTARQPGSGASAIWVARLDGSDAGSDAHPVTFGPGNFQLVRVLRSGRLLLAANAPLMDAASKNPQRALYQMRPDGSGLYRLPQAVALRLAQPEQPAAPTLLPGVFPQRYAAHPAPLLYPSILHLQSKTGRMLCLNAYQTMDATTGRIAGTIAQVRVLALGKDGRQRILGNAPVEQDGSFYLTVPADMPVRFALLDARGAVLHEQTSWIWARPKEDRGCAGCHENPAFAPENHWPLALKRFDTPTPVGAEAGISPAHKDDKR
jgi:hypothetical protein